MAKGLTRPAQPVRRVREADLAGGISGLERCIRRIVRIASDHTTAELRAMATGSVAIVGTQVVIQRHGRTVAIVRSDVAALRSCLEAGLRYEAELDKSRDQDGLRVPVRPLARR